MASVTVHPDFQSGLLNSPTRSRIRATSAFKAVLIAGCFLTIVGISALDTWFAVSNATIIHMEKNPICLALIKLDPSGFTCFIAGKSLGTVIVLLILLLLHTYKYRHAKWITLGVTLFQIGLLTHLTLSDPRTYHLPNFSLLFDDAAQSIWFIS